MLETPLSLIRRIRDPSDHASWHEFFGVYQSLVEALVRQCGVCDHDVEVVVQEVFVRVLKAAPDFKLDHQRGHFGTWLWTVVHHAAADYFRALQRLRRKEAPWQEHLQKIDSLTSFPDAAWLENERLHVLRLAMARVREQSQPNTWACFEEHLLKGRPAQEVAAELGLSPTAVYANTSRILARVRKQCAEYMEDLSDGDPSGLSG
jgi:RNA polymerase sigma factor (sigma-70 family)